MRFKTEEIKEEFSQAPTFLQKIVKDFCDLSYEMGVLPVMTRAWEQVPGSSGVHEAKRAVDFRDEFPSGRFLYDHEMRMRILNVMNHKYARRDKFKTVVWHSFRGGPSHFHIQMAPRMDIYFDKSDQVCKTCGQMT